MTITSEFLAGNSEVYLEHHTGATRPELGDHFGSRFPEDPLTATVYDFLPDVLLGALGNLAAFCGILVFDKWTANTDARQCVFFRPTIRKVYRNCRQPVRGRFVVHMIDHGFCFNGHNWSFVDAPLYGIYPRYPVYNGVTHPDAFSPWFERLSKISDEMFARILNGVPEAWVDEDEAQLETLFETLISRRKLVPDLIEQSWNKVIARKIGLLNTSELVPV